MSLLGKPLNYRSPKRDMKYRKLQAKIYNFLERPRGYKAILYHVIVFLAIFLCLLLSILSTMDDQDYRYEAILFGMELFIVVWFSVEYALRVWSSGCRSRYQGPWGRIKYAKRPFCCIDVVTIVATVVVLTQGSYQVGGTSGNQLVSAVRSLRFFQILRMVRMDRRGGSWKLLGSVVYAHRQELLTTLYIGFLGLIFSSFLMYMVESDRNPHFKNFPDTLWWGIITLCTVGYGDVVPVSWEGKIIASVCALLGITFFALPAGILGSGFALKVQQQQRQKHIIRRRQPAASLIQCLWRCYAADEKSLSVATWKVHQVPLPSPPSFKNNSSFVTRLPTIRRHRNNASSPSLKGRPSDAAPAGFCSATRQSRSEHNSSSKESDHLLLKKNSDDEEEDSQANVLQLTPPLKTAIRALRKIKYFIARRKFKEALKPYDVKDVIEQYSSGHADLLTRVKFLHGRLDQVLGKQGSTSVDVYNSKVSLASRIVKVERQVDDIESKIDHLTELYVEDRRYLVAMAHHLGLPSSEKTSAIESPEPAGKDEAKSVAKAPFASTPSQSSLTIPALNDPPQVSALQSKSFSSDKLSTCTHASLGHAKALSTESKVSQKFKKRVTLSSLPTKDMVRGVSREPDFLRVPRIVTPQTDPDGSCSHHEALNVSELSTEESKMSRESRKIVNFRGPKTKQDEFSSNRFDQMPPPKSSLARDVERGLPGSKENHSTFLRNSTSISTSLSGFGNGRKSDPCPQVNIAIEMQAKNSLLKRNSSDIPTRDSS